MVCNEGHADFTLPPMKRRSAAVAAPLSPLLGALRPIPLRVGVILDCFSFCLQVEMCSEGSTKWASSINYGAAKLKWAHAIWLVVSIGGLLTGGVLMSRSRHRRSAARHSLLDGP